MRRFLLLCCLLSLPGLSMAAEPAASAFGQIAIPAPLKPALAENCVEPTSVMRRDHMKFLLHQRDATVIDGDRDKRHSLIGCIDCHNPPRADGEIVRYDNPQHFCAGCHAYASVRIDCFECHADRSLDAVEQGLYQPGLTASTFVLQSEAARVD